MNGLKIFLEKYDPVRVNDILYHILNMHYKNCSKETNKIISKLRAWWIRKVTYPLLQRKVDKINTYAINLVVNHPETFVMVISRYICYMINHCKMFNVTFKELVKILFNDETITLNMELEDLENNNGKQIKSFDLIVKGNIPLPIKVEDKKEKFSVTTLNADMENKIFSISQIGYDTNSKDDYSTSRILYKKNFELRGDMKLHNPNYLLDSSIKDEDNMCFVFMICHIMSVFCNILQGTTLIDLDKMEKEVEDKQNKKEEV